MRTAGRQQGRRARPGTAWQTGDWA